MANVVSAPLAPSGGQEPGSPAAPLRLTATLRNEPSPREWSAPLPDRLWRRLPEARREEHERLVRRYEASVEHTRAAAAKLQTRQAQDEQALSAAILGDRTPPPPKAADAARDLEGAQQRQQELARAVYRSGAHLLDGVDDSVVLEALEEAKAEAAGLVDAIPELAAEAIAQIGQAGQRGLEASWLSQLARKRRLSPFRPRAGGSAPGHRLAAAAQHLRQAQAEIEEELREREERARGPVQHPAPRGFGPPEGGFPIGPVAPAA